MLLERFFKFLQYALSATYAGALDLLYLATGIALIGAALYLTSKH